ncbi:MAG: DUF2237 domain-containing protein [Saprospiraceae bacterium]|jgi:uncharacterized protein (DUF2237 family)|nr:DUF2237 domain-containing protein [Saprospiraceae bacterium]
MKKRKTSFLFMLFAIGLALFIHQKEAPKNASDFIRPSNQVQKNVLGSALQVCSKEPLTGFLRDGSCNTNRNDGCRHVVCAEMTKDFLEYTKKSGNDLSSRNTKSNFPGLKEGDFWCLCVSRWMEASNDRVPPPVLLHATHEETLKYIPIQTLQKEAVYTHEF